MNLRADIAGDIAHRDAAFRQVVATIGPVPTRRPARVSERFPALVESITYQLLATSAAYTIHQRVVATCGGTVSVQTVLDAGIPTLRSAGLSRTKAAAMVDLAVHARDGRVNLAGHGRMSDSAIIAEVTSVHGIGPWTAQMYLMHTLGRRDVWPVGDFGVRYGWSLLHDLDEMITQKELGICGERFIGVRSDVAWYCWQAVHLHRANR